MKLKDLVAIEAECKNHMTYLCARFKDSYTHNNNPNIRPTTHQERLTQALMHARLGENSAHFEIHQQIGERLDLLKDAAKQGKHQLFRALKDYA